MPPSKHTATVKAGKSGQLTAREIALALSGIPDSAQVKARVTFGGHIKALEFEWEEPDPEAAMADFDKGYQNHPTPPPLSVPLPYLDEVKGDSDALTRKQGQVETNVSVQPRVDGPSSPKRLRKALDDDRG